MGAVDKLSAKREGLREATSKVPFTILCRLDKGNLVLICRSKKKKRIAKLLEYLEGNLGCLTSSHIAQFKTDAEENCLACKIVKGLNDLINLPHFYLQSI